MQFRLFQRFFIVALFCGASPLVTLVSQLFMEQETRRDNLPPGGQGRFEIHNDMPAVDIFDAKGKLLAILRIPIPWAVSNDFPPHFLFAQTNNQQEMEIPKIITPDMALSSPCINGASFGLADDPAVRISRVAASDDTRHGWKVTIELEVVFPDGSCGIRRYGLVCTRQKPYVTYYVLLFHFDSRVGTLPEVPVTVKTYINQKLLQFAEEKK